MAGLALVALSAGTGAGTWATAPPALAAEPVVVDTGPEWAAAWADPAVDAITVAADIELACGENPDRAPGSLPLVVEGGGHAVADACLGGGSSFVTVVPTTLRDVALLGAADGAGSVLLGDQVAMDGAFVIVRNAGDGVRVGPGSTITDTTIDLESTGGIGLIVPGSTTLSGVEVRGEGDGIRVADEGVPDLDPTAIRGSRVVVSGIGLAVEDATAVERSSFDGSVAVFVATAGEVVLRDTTLVTSEGGRALAAEVGTQDLTLDQVTVVVPSGAAAVDLAPDTRVSLHATVLAGGTCTLGGALVSEGDNVATEAGCATTGTDDRVVADPGLAPYDPDTGWALPLADGPLVDAVASCGGSGTDQRGVARPQGPACDVGAVELAQEPVPTTTDSTPAGPPSPAPPATPVPAAARFTG